MNVVVVESLTRNASELAGDPPLVRIFDPETPTYGIVLPAH